MSKVVRLNDKVMNDIDRIMNYEKDTRFQDDPVMWHLIFDDADENYILEYVLESYIKAIIE